MSRYANLPTEPSSGSVRFSSLSAPPSRLTNLIADRCFLVSSLGRFLQSQRDIELCQFLGHLFWLGYLKFVNLQDDLEELLFGDTSRIDLDSMDL